MPLDIRLLIVDPQNDFCDLPAHDCPPGHAPALPVPGAHADMLRLAAFIDAAFPAITDMAVTLDTHHRIDVAHPGFWQRDDGSPVAPFTQITAQQVADGHYRPRNPAAHARVLAYVQALEAQGRHTLMVWPVHCELGTWGHAVHPAVRSAYHRWEDANTTQVIKVLKGLNPWTEHYSALQAEVPMPDDAGTGFNHALAHWAAAADLLLVAGEASSHCVSATLDHLLQALPEGHTERVVLLTDCTSPVQGFEAEVADYLRSVQARGVRLATSTEILPQVLGQAPG